MAELSDGKKKSESDLDVALRRAETNVGAATQEQGVSRPHFDDLVRRITSAPRVTRQVSQTERVGCDLSQRCGEVVRVCFQVMAEELGSWIQHYHVRIMRCANPHPRWQRQRPLARPAWIEIDPARDPGQ